MSYVLLCLNVNPFSTLNDSDRFFPGTVFEIWTLL